MDHATNFTNLHVGHNPDQHRSGLKRMHTLIKKKIVDLGFSHKLYFFTLTIFLYSKISFQLKMFKFIYIHFQAFVHSKGHALTFTRPCSGQSTRRGSNM